jgi:hypothetical protein
MPSPFHPGRLLAPLAFAMLLGGCGHSREVTPWLRTSSSWSPCLLAESGGHGCMTTSRVDRKEEGRWKRLYTDEDVAFAFAGGERAVVGRRLVRRTGDSERIECAGDLRAPPDGRELVCITMTDRRSASPQSTTIETLDIDARPIANRTVRWPVRVPDDEPPMGDYVSAQHLGFLPAGLVFSFELIRHDASRATGSAHRCDAFVLDANDVWHPLGALVYLTPEEWRCNFPRPWNELHGWHVDRGLTGKNSAGEPDP